MKMMAKRMEELKYADFLTLMYRSDCEEVTFAEHQKIICEKVEGTFTAKKKTDV